MKHDQEKLTLEDVWKSFKNGFSQSSKAKKLLEELKLINPPEEIGYNSGQLHHNKPKWFKDELIRLGVAVETNNPSKTGQSLRLFASQRLVYPLRNKAGELINLYTIDKDNTKRYLYPTRNVSGSQTPPEENVLETDKSPDKRFSSLNKSVEDTETFQEEREEYQKKGIHTTETFPNATETLQVINSQRLRMTTETFHYNVLGHLDEDYASLNVTLLVEEKSTREKERLKLDLYERLSVNSLVTNLAETFHVTFDEVLQDINQLTEQLELYRNTLLEQELESEQRHKVSMTPLSTAETKKAVELLQSPSLMETINKSLEEGGIVGEEASRLLLFISASTYKTDNPLHVLVQGTSGSGKSHLLNTIASCMPEEDVISMTRVTSKSFYHYREDELVGKLMLIQDFDGLDEEAQYAFRELQTAKEISSSTTYKNSKGELMSKIKKVKSQFASILATTKADVYYDNMSRCIVIGVDESETQTIKIIEHQNRQLAGLIDYSQITKSQRLLKNIIRCLRHHEVVNPYADKIKLPMEAKMQRRLNNQFQAFIRQVTLLHQYQRQKSPTGALITEIKDIEIAINILFEAIMLKVDELDSSLRQFFDQMKEWVGKNGDKEKEFYQRDIRQVLNISKSSCFRYMEDLLQLEYISRTGGYSNRGYRYRIEYWDNMQKVKAEIKENLTEQISALKHHNGKN